MSKKKRMCVVRIFNHDHNTTLRLSHERARAAALITIISVIITVGLRIVFKRWWWSWLRR